MSSVDPQTVANVDEERHADDHACLHGRRLGPAAGCIALEAGIGLGHFQGDRNRQFDIDRFAAVGQEIDTSFSFRYLIASDTADSLSANCSNVSVSMK